VDDVDKLAERLGAKRIEFAGPVAIHLDNRGIMLRDPDGLCVLVQSPTESSPDWIKEMVK
jgi:hypothetical protein